LILSGCPSEEDAASASDANDAAGTTDHTHRWKGEGEAGSLAAPKQSSPAPPGEGSPGGGGAAGSEQGASEAAPEATIVHSELGPEELVRHYLMLGSAGDLVRIADYVDPRCYEGPVGRVDAVRLVGTLMTLDALTLAVVYQTDDKARVNYHLVGGVTAGEKKSETSILGEEIGERAAILTTDEVERRGSLDLAVVDSLWRVTCAFSYLPAQSDGDATP